jgi:ATP-binding cassette subfamily B protein
MKMENSSVKKSIINVVKNNKKLIVLLSFTVIVLVLASLVPPQILKNVIDYNFSMKTDNGLLQSAVLYIFVIFIIGIFDFAKEALLTVIGQDITREIRLEMMSKLEKINALYFSKNESGQIVSRFTNDVDAINSMFTGGIIGMLVDCFKIIGVVISIWLFGWKLGVITLLILPLIFVITRIFQKRMLSAQMENRVLIGKVNNHITESFKNILMIKSFSKEKYMEQNYTEILKQNFSTVEKVNFYDSIFSPTILMMRSVVIAMIVILSSGSINFIGISLGMIAATIDLISSLISPVENLGMELQSIQQSISGIKRVDEFFKENEDEKKKEEHVELNLDEINISFNFVSFCYEDGRKILYDLNLNINAREKVTFVGRTGVGKTTLFKLITGILKPTEGSIEINGINVYDIPNSDKRKIFGYVEQSFHMIKGTVTEQISLGDKSVTAEEVRSAAEFVGLDDYINTLDKGYDTVVKNENLFSQGQKQLLAIARAIVKNPPILLLDEVTANLDSITEDRIMSVLQKAGEKYTILTISHRLSSIVSADRIVIMEKGRIKNSGTPEELLRKDDWYRSRIALDKLSWR